MAQLQCCDNEVVTIESYLGGVSPLVTEDVITMLLVDRSIEPGSDIADVDIRDRYLLRADALLWCATSPSTNGGTEEQVGNWKSKRSGNTTTSADKAAMKRMARAIYRKWNEPWPWPSSVTIVNRGMSI